MQFIKYRAVFIEAQVGAIDTGMAGPPVLYSPWNITHVEDTMTVRAFVEDRDKVCASLKNYKGTEAVKVPSTAPEVQSYIRRAIEGYKHQTKEAKKNMTILENYIIK